MAGLNEREIRVVRSCFVEDGPSLDVLAEELGVTRHRVRQIRDEAVDHVRLQLRRRGLGLDDLVAG
jgi:DNA-directed RNA polymerase sigma subunit (sigma70/sigma32)